MTQMNLNIIKYMITTHTVDDIKINVLKNVKRQCKISTSTIIYVDEVSKFSFSTFIVKYNSHMRELDENAQQRVYYSLYQFDCQY